MNFLGDLMSLSPPTGVVVVVVVDVVVVVVAAAVVAVVVVVVVVATAPVQRLFKHNDTKQCNVCSFVNNRIFPRFQLL